MRHGRAEQGKTTQGNSDWKYTAIGNAMWDDVLAGKSEASVVAGDCREVLRAMPAGCVHVCITSPPYFGLRSYLRDGDPLRVRELGAEALHDCGAWARGEEPCAVPCYVCNLRHVAREVWRVLRDDGTFFLVLGDSSSRNPAKGDNSGYGKHGDWCGEVLCGNRPLVLPEKNLCMVPARVALALQADGWYLRSEIVWAKGTSFCPSYAGSVMPESVTDRPTRAHEMIYLLAKQPRYYYDAEAVRERGSIAAGVRAAKGSDVRSELKDVNSRPPEYWEYNGTRNLRDCWAISPRGFDGAHFAVFPPDLVRPMVRAATSERGCCAACGAPWARVVERTDELDPSARGSRFDTGKTLIHQKGDMQPGERYRKATTGWQPTCSCGCKETVPALVLDPFCGSGTTGMVARQEGRRFIGVDLSEDYCAMARDRIARYYQRDARAKRGKAAAPSLFEEVEGAQTDAPSV